MNNETKGICAGGNYTVNKEYKPTSPSKRHNAAIEQERLKNMVGAERRLNLARFIGNYIHTKTNNTNDFTKIIYDAIGKFEYDK